MDLDDRKHDTIQGIRQIIATYTVYWHKLAVDSMIFIMTGCIALTGYSLSRTSESHGSIVSLSLLIVALSIIGASLCRLIEEKTESHRDILAKLDNIDSLLVKDAYIQGDSIYPQEWAVVGKGRYKDPIFRFCFWLQIFMPFFLVSIVVLTSW